MIEKIRRDLPSLLVLITLLVIGTILFVLAHDTKTEEVTPEGDYIEYEKCRVDEIMSDSCEPDEVAEGNMRGTQELTAVVLTGQYEGKTLLVDNTVGPVYGSPLEVGDKFVAGISTYSNGEIRATVYEYDRSTYIFIVIALFLAITIVIGRKTGAKSVIGLVITVLAILFILLPLLLKGWSTIPTTLLICVWITLIAFVILGGISKKTICACAGTLAGILIATIIAIIVQSLVRITGYRQEYAEALLQLRQTGESTIGITGLVVAGVIVSSLGAVMDVAMSISSALNEIANVGKDLTVRELLKSGMNVGRDMVGTMTNTLILAVIGSSMTLMVYISSLGLPIRQFLASAFFALEVISGLASSFGVILAVPFTALISALMLGKRRK